MIASAAKDTGLVTRFRSPLSAEYISQTVSGSALLPETCPENCRPKDHPEWTRC